MLSTNPKCFLDRKGREQSMGWPRNLERHENKMEKNLMGDGKHLF